MKNDEKKLAHVAAGMSVEIDQLVERGLLPVGEFVTIETINPIYHGRLVGVTPSFYMLSECSWLGDLGQRSAYEAGADPVEANYMGGTSAAPKLVERSSCVLGPSRAPIQKALSREK